MSKNNTKQLEAFGENLVEFPLLVNSNKTRYTLGRSWVNKVDFDEYFGKTAMQMVTEVLQLNSLKHNNVTPNKEQKMKKLDMKGIWKGAKTVNTFEKTANGKVIYKHVIKEGGENEDQFGTQGVCHDWDCPGRDGADVNRMFTELLNWDDINDLSVKMAKLDYKFGILANYLERTFTKVDVTYVKDDFEVDQTSFTDKYPNAFLNIKTLHYDGGAFFKELSELYTNEETDTYGSIVGKMKKMKSAFWDNHHVNKALWNVNNGAIKSYGEDYGAEFEEDDDYGEKLGKVYAAIRDTFTETNHQTIIHSENVATCACCGSEKVSVDYSKYNSQFGVQKGDIYREFNSWTIPSKEGVRYVFKNGKLVSTFTDVNTFDINVDIDMDKDDDSFEIDVDIEIDLDIDVNEVVEEVSTDMWNPASDDEMVEDDEQFGHVLPFEESSEPLGESFDEFNKLIDEQRNEYNKMKYNECTDYDYIFDLAPEEAAKKNRFLRGLRACLVEGVDKSDIRELEEQYTKSIWA